MGPAGGLARGPAWWAALALLRVAGCLLPQPGYLHPDEFFQSPEVMAGDILDLQLTLYILPPFNQRIAQTVLKRSTHSALQTHVHPRQWGQSRLSDGCAGPQQSAGNSQGPTGDRPW
ncbi:GPI mannosyltransferase 4 isoform B [Alligator mississippiensis]|uniref:GPI mannosyltransferase 4 isoform B n=1 Tax=Alligator mississippiensis TaxID=8496 RepID=A0A151P8E8_ALLMI|nr:GPI mannosyltransferase 4 isoform B [Alligator mississippiensis]